MKKYLINILRLVIQGTGQLLSLFLWIGATSGSAQDLLLAKTAGGRLRWDFLFYLTHAKHVLYSFEQSY